MTMLSDDINDYCFIDFETRALPGVTGTDESVVTAGTYRYAAKSYPVILTWAIGDNPVQCIELTDFDKRILWSSMPPSLWGFYTQAAAGHGWFAAWNMGFDRAVWNQAFPVWLPPELTIDVMAQAVASNMPPSLEGASRFIGRAGKQDDGKNLIKLFSPADGGTPQSHPEEWARYKSYAVRDTHELREVFKATRKLPRREWEEYWASERINERGQAVDVPYACRAAAVAELEKGRINKRLVILTNGVISKVTQAARIGNWVYDRLDDAAARDLLVKEWNEAEEDEDGELTQTVGKISVARTRLEALIAFYAAREEKMDGLTDDEWRLGLAG